MGTEERGENCEECREKGKGSARIIKKEHASCDQTFSRLKAPYACAAVGRSLCHPTKAKWKSKLVGTIKDR